MLEAARTGLDIYTPDHAPATRRLGFRELGLVIGLHAEPLDDALRDELLEFWTDSDQPRHPDLARAPGHQRRDAGDRAGPGPIQGSQLITTRPLPARAPALLVWLTPALNEPPPPPPA